MIGMTFVQKVGGPCLLRSVRGTVRRRCVRVFSQLVLVRLAMRKRHHGTRKSRVEGQHRHEEAEYESEAHRGRKLVALVGCATREIQIRQYSFLASVSRVPRKWSMTSINPPLERRCPSHFRCRAVTETVNKGQEKSPLSH